MSTKGGCIYNYNFFLDSHTLRRYEGCFRQFNDDTDMCTVLKQWCPDHIICKNGTVIPQVSHHQKQGN